MPIEITRPICSLDQESFGEIAHEVMSSAFALHNEIGRFFNEGTYQRGLVKLLGGRALAETQIRVRYRGFCKRYYLDLVVDDGAIFELKAMSELTDYHRAQLLSYLLLVESKHGKLVNFGGSRVEHEFVNTTLTHEDRIGFEVEDCGWQGGNQLQEWIVGFLRDWGTGLDLRLYEEAAAHPLGGLEEMLAHTLVIWKGERIGKHKVRLTAPGEALKITTLNHAVDEFREEARRFLKHTELKCIHWVNVELRSVTFSTIRN